MYMQAPVDETQHYTDHYPPIEEGTLSPEAISFLEMISDMHQTDSEGVPEDGEWNYYARRFSEDMGWASANGGNLRYLLATRYSIYDALAPDYPIYAELKKVASVPNACVFRIKPDGDAYLEESAKHIDLLPPLSE